MGGAPIVGTPTISWQRRAGSLGALGLACAIGLDALLLELGHAGLLARNPRRLALEVALAALLFAAARILRSGPRALQTPLGAFLLSLALFTANTRPLWSGDTEAAVLLPYALVRHQTFALDAVACTRPRAPPMYAAVPGRAGHLWSRYPITMGLLALPLELPAALSRTDPCAPIGRDVEKVSAAILAALVCALLFSALRGLVAENVALLALALWTVGTAALPVLGQALWQHTGTALGAALALRALLNDTGRRRAIWVGIGAGLIAACRPPDVPIALAILWAHARLAGQEEHRARRVLEAALLAAALIAVQIAYQWQAFGGPLRSGYGDEAVHGWTLSQAPLALLGLLFSPGRGLLLWSPILLIALLPAIRLPRIPFAPAIRPLLCGAAAQLAVISCWWAWHGGSTFGPRMHAGGLPLFAPLLALGLSSLRSPRAKITAGALALLSIAPTALITYVPPRHGAGEAIIHLHAPGEAWSPRAWPPLGYLLPDRQSVSMLK